MRSARCRSVPFQDAASPAPGDSHLASSCWRRPSCSAQQREEEMAGELARTRLALESERAAARELRRHAREQGARIRRRMSEEHEQDLRRREDLLLRRHQAELARLRHLAERRDREAEKERTAWAEHLRGCRGQQAPPISFLRKLRQWRKKGSEGGEDGHARKVRKFYCTYESSVVPMEVLLYLCEFCCTYASSTVSDGSCGTYGGSLLCQS